MYKNIYTTLVIPCRNEEAGIGQVIADTPNWVDEIIVVDNKSTDSSSSIAKKAGARVITESRVGYGQAYLTGFAAAHEGLILTADADGQYRVLELEKLINFYIDNNLDLVVGNRIQNNNKPHGLTTLRYWGNKIFSYITRFLFSSKITDSQSGMWIFHKSILPKLKLTSTGMSLSEEIKIKTILYGYKYGEIAISYDARQGNSKLSVIKDGSKNLWFLVYLFFLLRKKLLLKILFWVVISGLMIYLLFSISGIPGGDDGYRHIKFAYIIRTEGLKEALKYPWLVYTFPYNKPIDLWVLYHLLLTPFTLLTNLVLALKVANLVFLGVFSFVFYKLLSHLKIAYKEFWIAFLFFGSIDFLFRLLLGRPLLINIIFITLSLFVFLKHKYGWLILISALFMLNNVAAVLLIPLAGIYSISLYISERKIEFRPLLHVLLGLGVGLLIHPQFPSNISLTITQIFSTQFTSLKEGIEVGNEIYPYNFEGFIKSNALVLVIWLAALFLSYKKYCKYKLSTSEILLLIFSGFTFFFTLKSRRFVEYWIPVSIIFSALIYSHYVNQLSWAVFKNTWQKFYEFKTAVILVVIVIGIIFSSNYWRQFNAIHSSPDLHQLEGAGLWLAQNTEKNEIIFNTQWDQFPPLFFWNDQNRYIVGIDPTFMYIRDPELYRKWRIVTNENSAQWQNEELIANTIKSDFQSKYLLIQTSRNPELLNFINNHPNQFELVYREPLVEIFRVK